MTAEFQSLVRVDWLWNWRPLGLFAILSSFNPSCGLIGCGTLYVRAVPPVGVFQSLVRVDWLWNFLGHGYRPRTRRFQSLVRVDWLWNPVFLRRLLHFLTGFNPSCGLIGCGTGCHRWPPRCGIAQFQSLVRVDWLWNWGAFAEAGWPTSALFQSLVRVDWLWNRDAKCLGRQDGPVSIPRAG